MENKTMVRKPRKAKIWLEGDTSAVVWLTPPDTGKLTAMIINKNNPALSRWMTREEQDTLLLGM